MLRVHYMTCTYKFVREPPLVHTYIYTPHIFTQTVNYVGVLVTCNTNFITSPLLRRIFRQAIFQSRTEKLGPKPPTPAQCELKTAHDRRRHRDDNVQDWRLDIRSEARCDRTDEKSQCRWFVNSNWGLLNRRLISARFR
ncbi:hypothetical protein EVAR_46640_1 [Eumeta japonica]|uniref:Uncharacterized protein n=1 Tax=Eumeta variegata TaxID=151549 RepID=A0A4C1WF83_EUMVA|nr:hypothetical protein EVAR_46640_1 [Eumeta japonica]